RRWCTKVFRRSARTQSRLLLAPPLDSTWPDLIPHELQSRQMQKSRRLRHAADIFVSALLYQTKATAEPHQSIDAQTRAQPHFRPNCPAILPRVHNCIATNPARRISSEP